MLHCNTKVCAQSLRPKEADLRLTETGSSFVLMIQKGGRQK